MLTTESSSDAVDKLVAFLEIALKALRDVSINWFTCLDISKKKPSLPSTFTAAVKSPPAAAAIIPPISLVVSPAMRLFSRSASANLAACCRLTCNSATALAIWPISLVKSVLRTSVSKRAAARSAKAFFKLVIGSLIDLLTKVTIIKDITSAASNITPINHFILSAATPAASIFFAAPSTFTSATSLISPINLARVA